MDIDALRSFIAFVDTGSFTRAAKQIHRTQGAISMQMKKLEEEIGQPLFIKEGRNMGLTDQGRKLTSYARRILTLHDAAVGEMNRSKDHPPLRLGCPDDYSAKILPKVIEQLHQQTPELEVIVKCYTSVQLRLLLDKGEIDAAILTRAPEKEEGYLLQHETGVWVHGGYPELLHEPVLPLILYEADCKFHATAVDGLDKLDRPFRLVTQCGSATVIGSMVRSGAGIGAMARSAATDDLTIINDTNLPELPSVDIELALAPHPHPLLSAQDAARIANNFV